MSITDTLSGERPRPTWLFVFLIASALFVVIDFRGTGLESLVAGLTGPETASGTVGMLLTGILVGGLFTANAYAISRMPHLFQVWITWAELLVLFLAFFWSFDLSYEFIEKKITFLLGGAWTTIYISVISIILASAIAMAGALARLSDNGFAYGCATFYTSFFRGLPLLMQLYLVYIGLPQMGFVIDPIPAGIIALSLCYGAYMAEIFRAGIQGVPEGQREAAAALGLHKGLTFRKIVLPQAMKLIVPPTGNQFIAMLKDSSLVSVVGVWDLTYRAKTAGRAEFKHLEMLITAALIYWLLTIVLEIVQSKIEAHYGKGDIR
ncbi:amino acid ABC transporter permease [Aestuariispira insulae]|uniref:Glutamate/aspartate import permease protein GltK n=1 Tax=Aestuariispira insulae TaxID=1461337 RepID=A0A3D9HS08_9PROT|nr:amino acid ABC transporter permease [Aestuariispira insulae]RED52288.1 amino acid ABC transporter membrane protein (PAAT family) [Aestuariispira insulae]